LIARGSEVADVGGEAVADHIEAGKSLAQVADDLPLVDCASVVR
jgi:hypothetical protein